MLKGYDKKDFHYIDTESSPTWDFHWKSISKEKAKSIRLEEMASNTLKGLEDSMQKWKKAQEETKRGLVGEEKEMAELNWALMGKIPFGSLITNLEWRPSGILEVAWQEPRDKMSHTKWAAYLEMPLQDYTRQFINPQISRKHSLKEDFFNVIEALGKMPVRMSQGLFETGPATIDPSLLKLLPIYAQPKPLAVMDLIVTPLQGGPKVQSSTGRISRLMKFKDVYIFKVQILNTTHTRAIPMWLVNLHHDWARGHSLEKPNLDKFVDVLEKLPDEFFQPLVLLFGDLLGVMALDVDLRPRVQRLQKRLLE